MSSDETSEVTGDRWRVIGSGIVGNVLEWYDFALYGYLAPVTATLFFPSKDPLVSLVQSFAVFAVGSLARPIGGLLLGRVGDRLGRRALLMLSAVLMGAPTFLMGLLPTYASVGIMAPILLVLLRLMQGLSAGGEFTGSITFLVEHAPRRRQGLYGSFSNVGAMMGGLLGAGAGWLTTSSIGTEALHDWGWRIPFLSGIVVSACGFFIRLRVPDSPTYLRLKGQGALVRRATWTTFQKHFKPMAVTVGLNWVVSAGYYVVFVWLVTDLSKVAGVALHTALGVGTLGLMFGLFCTLLMGQLSDIVGQRRVLVAGTLATAIAVIPLLLLADQGTLLSAVAAQLGLALVVSCFLGTLPAVFVSLFPADVRCSALSVGYNITIALFGGTAPLVATYLVKATGWSAAPGIYLAATALICLALVPLVPEASSDQSPCR
ncbi:MAG TPA: MFS transporter [Candidatus Binatia bacterium]|nr:MFS transporter [Candidatus Binatia bacterium]